MSNLTANNKISYRNLKMTIMDDATLEKHLKYEAYLAKINYRAYFARQRRIDSRDENGKVIDIKPNPILSFLQDVEDTMEKINNETKEKELRKQARDKQEIHSETQRRQNAIKNRNRYLLRRRNKTKN